MEFRIWSRQQKSCLKVFVCLDYEQFGVRTLIYKLKSQRGQPWSTRFDFWKDASNKAALNEYLHQPECNWWEKHPISTCQWQNKSKPWVLFQEWFLLIKAEDLYMVWTHPASDYWFLLYYCPKELLFMNFSSLYRKLENQTWAFLDLLFGKLRRWAPL